MFKRIHLALLLLALAILFCGCSDYGSLGTKADDSNLNSNMSMGGGSENGSTDHYSADNTPVPGPISPEPNSETPAVSSSVNENGGPEPKEIIEASEKNAVLFCDRYNIFLMSIESGQYRPLTKDGNDEAYYTAPIWAKDGIIFIKEFTKDSAICRISTNGENMRTLLTFSERIRCAEISPDGKQIVYCMADSGAIRVMDINGSNNHLLVEAKGSDPVWSPEGNKIAFTCLDSDNKSFIYTINPNGTDAKNLTQRFAVCGKQPSWSPNGKRIVFSTGHDLCIIEADGSGLTYLTNDDVKYCENPCWLANGTEIISEYRMKQDGERYFCLIDVVKNTIKLITANQSR